MQKVPNPFFIKGRFREHIQDWMSYVETYQPFSSIWHIQAKD